MAYQAAPRTLQKVKHMEPRPITLKALRALNANLESRYKNRALYLVRLCKVLGIEPGKTAAENEVAIEAAIVRLLLAARNSNIVKLKR